MAARALLQRRTGTVSFAAAIAAGAYGLRPPFALADTFEEMPQSRKPIYDDGGQAWSLTPHYKPHRARRPTPTDRLAAHVGSARRFLYAQALTVEQLVNRAASTALAVEDAVARTVQSLAPPRDSGERLLPGAVYVLVAAMAGTMGARNRGLLLRAALPAMLGVGAARLVLPITSRNVADLAWSYEQKMPAVADAHTRARDAVVGGLRTAVSHSRAAVRAVDDRVTSTRDAVEGWLRKGA